MQLHNVFHADRLSKSTETKEYGIHDEPEPIEVEGELEYEVEKVLDAKLDRRRRQGDRILFLVKWKGYGDGSNLWIPRSSAENAGEAIAVFYRENPSAPRELSAAVFASLPWQELDNYTEMPHNGYAWEDGKYGP